MDLNALFAECLDQHHQHLTAKGLKLAYAYAKALDLVRGCLDPITTPRQLKALPFVGAKIFVFLCKRLQRHCFENGLDVPPEFVNYVEAEVGGTRAAELDLEAAPKKRRKTPAWIPKRRSGSWAILVALYTQDRARRGLRKDTLIAAATPLCDTSFTANPAARDFYLAWDGIKTLLKRELVDCVGRPKSYVITEDGEKMAAAIVLHEGWDQTDSPQRADMSFDNGVRLSSDTPDQQTPQHPLEQAPKPVTGAVPKSAPLFVGSSTLSSPLAPRSTLTNHTPLPLSPLRHVHPPALQPQSAQSSGKVHKVADRIYDGTSYDIWTPADYEVVLVMDNREVRSQKERDFFQTRIAGHNIPCEVRPLAVGDVLWVARNKHTGQEAVLNYVSERKRLDDLAGLIRDGRFAEQKARLRRSGLTHIHYLVEEGGLADVQRIAEMKKSIETAIAMVVTVLHFHLHRFRRTDETIDWLVTMTKVLAERYLEIRLIVAKPRSVNSQDEYLQLLTLFRDKFEKKHNHECVHTMPMFQECLVKSNMMTVKEMFMLMLTLVKGISFEKAVLIQNKFKTPRGLIEYYIAHANLSPEAAGRLMMEMFLDQVGAKKFNKAALLAMYEAWGDRKSVTNES